MDCLVTKDNSSYLNFKFNFLESIRTYQSRAVTQNQMAVISHLHYGSFKITLRILISVKTMSTIERLVIYACDISIVTMKNKRIIFLF